MQDYVTDWQSPVIPPTIRRPWRVFEEDLEEKVTAEASQIGQVGSDVREQIAAVQAKGARVAFLSLSETERETYNQVALCELAAFVFWRRSQLARQKTGEILPTDLEAGWDVLDHESKGEWLPQDPIAFLKADAQWATLVAGMKGGGEHLPGTEDLNVSAVPTPLKNEVKSKAPAEKAPTKMEKASPAPPAAVQAPTKKEPKAPAPAARAVKSAEAPKAGAAQPSSAPADVANQKAPVKKEMQIVPKAAEPPPAAKASVKKEKTTPAPSKAAAAVPPKPVKKEPTAATHKPAEAAGGAAPTPSVTIKKEAPTAPKPAAAAPGPASSGHEGALQPALSKPEKRKQAAPKATAKAPPKAKPAAAPRGRGSSRPKPGADGDGADGSKVTEKAVVADDKADKPDKPATTGRAARVRSRTTATTQQVAVQGSRRPRAQDLGPANLFPEVLDAKCCKCNEGHASMENDLAMCDRCDRAYHAKCHEPPVAYFGRPDDQWFCAACTEELAQMRELSLKVDDFCWVTCAGETHPWPAQVLRIDFCSLADPRPYWVQYFDAGPPEGQWVGEVNVRLWQDGPRWGSIGQARRRNAVRLAEAAGAPSLSTEEPAPRTPKRKQRPAPPPLEGDSPKSTEKKRKRPAKEPVAPAEGPGPRRSRRVQEMLDKVHTDVGQKEPVPTAKLARRRVQDQKDDQEDEVVQEASEMRNLIAAAKERQRKIEGEVAQAS